MSALAVADATTVTRPASVRPAYLGRPRGARLRPVPGAAVTADPVTVTISIDGGSAGGRARVLAALRELVEAAGPDAAFALESAPPEPSAPGTISLDPRPRTVDRDGWPLHLSRLEYDLLLFLARHPRQVFSRSQLLAQVWGHTHTTARTVDVHVSRLRTKLGDQDIVTTVYGLGYRLADEAAVSVAGE
jgi:two-component system response regulator MtrA